MNLGIETETLEFKKSTGELKEAMYSIGAMLNKHQHGELYFGIKTDGKECIYVKFEGIKFHILLMILQRFA